MGTVAYYIRESISFIVTYVLCAFYSLTVLGGILVLFVTKAHTKFWQAKSRPVPPPCLQQHDYGVHKYQNANGIKIHYVESGDHSKPLMVLVHGFPEFWYSWRHQLKEFSKDYWVVALDMRGYGDTEKPEYRYAYRIDNLTEDIRCLVRALANSQVLYIGARCSVDGSQGIKIHYVESGDHSKPLMVLVHGFPEFWYSWRHQLKEFSKDYWVVALDMRGYGDTEKPEYRYAYRIDNLTEDIRCLVRALAPGRPKFTLVAHDWGAVVGWHFVTKHMELVDRYIMMDAPSSRVARKLFATSKTQFKMSWYIFFYQMPWLPEFFLRLMDLRIFKVVFREHGGDEVIEAYKYTFSKPNALTYPINYYRQNLRFFAGDPPAKPKTFAPGLYLLGEKDAYVSKETGPLLQRDFENLDFKIVPGVDHFLQQHNPELVNRYMREFLAKS